MHANLPITLDEAKIAQFCRERGIRKMSLFGSVVRDDFDPVRSDVDVLVEFLPGHIPAWEFFRWGEELRALIGRKVDLHSKLGQRLEAHVRPDLMTVYEQA